MKLLRYFLVLFLLFGMIGGVFGGKVADNINSQTAKEISLPEANTNPLSSPTSTSSTSSTIILKNKQNIKFTYKKIGTTSGEIAYQYDNGDKKNPRYELYDITGRAIDKDGLYVSSKGGIDHSTKEGSAKSGLFDAFTTYSENLAKNSDTATPTELSSLQSNGVEINWKPAYKKLQKNHEIMFASCKGDLSSDSCKTAKEDYNDAYERVNLNKDLSSTLTSMEPNQRIAFMQQYNTNECKDAWFEGLCKSFAASTARDVAVNDYLSQISGLNENRLTSAEEIKILNENEYNGCNVPLTDLCRNLLNNIISQSPQLYINNYNQQIADLAFTGITSAFSRPSGSCTNVIDTTCIDAIETQLGECNDDAACREQGAIVLARARAGEGRTEVETNALFSVLSAIANPDRDAMNAARLFGFEPDYSNIERMLGSEIGGLIANPISSQICSDKIDGYLDKTRDDSNGQGGSGITSYGCSDSYSYDYDTETNRHETTGDPNCVNVLLDLRAQRTQITPDNKVAITYSTYIKAPDDQAIKYITAITYSLKNGQTKKELLKPELNFTSVSAGQVKTEYETVNFRLNISKENIDISKAFNIYLVAIYDNANENIYLNKNTPIVLIGRTDTYTGISNDGSSSSSTSSTSNPATPQDLLSLVN